MNGIIDHFRKGAQMRMRYRAVFNSDDGKAVLAHLAKLCHVTDTSFTNDPRLAAWREGRRALWNQISKILNTDDERLIEEIKNLQNQTNEFEL